MVNNIEEEYEEFGKWAFGKQICEEYVDIDVVEKWNELHGDVFRIHDDNSMMKDIIKMVILWHKETQ